MDFNKIKVEPKQLTNVKNTDVNDTVFTKKCKICTHKGKNLIQHYLKEHSSNEVFCSRLPKNISEFLKKNKAGMLHADGYGMKLKSTGSKVFGICIFCGEEMYESPKQWITHYTRHTGEFEYLCTCGHKAWVAKTMTKHVKQCPERGSYYKDEIVMDTKISIDAYMCGDCNFIQLKEDNLRSHILSEHDSAPLFYKVVLLNFADESVKEHHDLYLKMCKSMIDDSEQTEEENTKQEEGIFKATDDKDGDENSSHAILSAISTTMPNELVSGIANTLHERLNENSKTSLEDATIAPTVKNEMITCGDDTTDSISKSEKSNIIPRGVNTANTQEMNPIEYDDDEWEDIESDSDDSIISQSSRSSSNRKFTRLVQKIGLNVGTKRKSVTSTDPDFPKKIKVESSPLSSNKSMNSFVPSNDLLCHESLEDGNVGKVENLMYKHLSNATSYHCLVEKCLYISNEVDNFTGHLIKVHDDDTWSGYCDLCQTNKYPMGQTLIKEFHHLVNDHVRQATELMSPISEANKTDTKLPAIRIRRLSGDKLSVKSEVFKLPTTPTIIKSTTIRRITYSPEERSSPPSVTVSPTMAILNKASVSTVVPFTPCIKSQQSLLKPLMSTVSSALANPTPSVSPSPNAVPSTIRIQAVTSKSSFTVDNADISMKDVASVTQPGKIKQRRLTVGGAQLAGEKPTTCNVQNIWSKQTMIKPLATVNTMPIIKRVAEHSDIINPIKPWTKKACTKPREVMQKMLRKEVLLAPFKCMGNDCWYFTTSETDMATHLQEHDKIIEDNCGQTSISDTNSWLECAYCIYMAANTKDLMEHLMTDHMDSEYLCQICFYRGCNVNYVARHLNNVHRANCSVWRIKPLVKSACSVANPIRCVRENVKLLTCIKCNCKFLNFIHFEQHLKEHSADVFQCGFCKLIVKIDIMKKHMTCHSIGHFECIYCKYANARKDSLAQHMCEQHSNQKPIYYDRDKIQEHIDKFKLSEFDDLWMTHMTVETMKVSNIPYIDPKAAFATSDKPTPTAGVAPTNVPIATVQSPSAAAPMLVISNVCSLRQDQDQPKPANTPSSAPFSSLVIKNVCSISKESLINATPVSKDITGVTVVKSSKVGEGPSQQKIGVGAQSPNHGKKPQDVRTPTVIKDPIASWVAKTGTPLGDLLKCSEQDCKFQASNEEEFKTHIDKSHSTILLKCSQCVNNVFWPSKASLWTHLETHAQKRFFCFQCDYVAKTEQQIEHHCKMSVHHRWLTYTTVLLSDGVDGGVYLSCPKNSTKENIDQFKADLVKKLQRREISPKSTSNPASTNTGKDCYGPDEIDLLPTKPVVASNIHCKLCNYKTQIVKNLIRHFDAHRQATVVPKHDPVNPVPCLTGNEKNFDKMTNLACSSNVNANKMKVANAPIFVPLQKRFVCAVDKHITMDELILRSHLNALHSKEKTYKCPHCNLELLKGHFVVDAIINHYRLHGEKLFMCEKCDFMNESLASVDKHIKNIHTGSGNTIVLRDEKRLETFSAATRGDPAVQSPTEAGVTKRWLCSMCSETTALKVDMATHVLVQHNLKYQYKCGYCDVVHCSRNYLIEHIKIRHKKAGVSIMETYSAIEIDNSNVPVNFWRRDEGGTKSIRGIPCEASEAQLKVTEDDDDYISEDDFMPEPTASASLLLNKTAVTIESLKRKPDDLELSLQMKKPRVDRMIECTICGKRTQNALSMHIVHFPDCHPGVPVSTRYIEFGEDASKDKGQTTEAALKAFQGYSLLCFHCKQMYLELNELKKHYVATHTEDIITARDSNTNPPFWYQIAKMMWCGLCRQLYGTYDEMRIHLEDIHKSTSVIVTSRKDNMVCGACDYNAGDDQNLLRHARLRHTDKELSMTLNISQAVLDEMVKIEVFQMKRCTMCKETICDFDGHQCENHLRFKHSGSILATVVSVRNPAYICPRCHQIFDSETSAYTHILSHVNSFGCALCNTYYAKHEAVVEHIQNKHSGDMTTYKFNFPVSDILKILVVFPNGLVQCLDKLQQTRYRFDANNFKHSRNEIMRKLHQTTHNK